MGSTNDNARVPLFSTAAPLSDPSVTTSFEPFEHRYLDALSEEGIDLHAFLASWRRAMDDDLERLSALRAQGDVDRLHDVLHRLSGAAGLVGAHSLMAALQRASTLPLEHETSSIDALTERTRTLMTQLETVPHAASRSTLR